MFSDDESDEEKWSYEKAMLEELNDKKRKMILKKRTPRMEWVPKKKEIQRRGSQKSQIRRRKS